VGVLDAVKNLGHRLRVWLTALCFVSDDDPRSISASIVEAPSDAQISAFIGSVVRPPSGNGLHARSLPSDSRPQPFNDFTRYYAVPSTRWYHAQLQSNVDPFVVVQF
jgi:hypothetical protein